MRYFQAFPWAPTVDGEFLVDTPYNLLKSGRFHRKDALLGTNRDEGSFWILPELPGFSRHNSSLQNLTMFRQAVDVITWDLNTDQVIHVTTVYCVQFVGGLIVPYICLRSQYASRLE